MKLSIVLTRFPGLSTLVVLTGAWGVLSPGLSAAGPNETQPKTTVVQRSFSSPEEAIQALQAATASKDQGALGAIFGPEFHELATGDKVQDANNAERFATAIAQSCHPVPEGEGKITLELGTNNWPMPIPLVQAGGQWRFDTEAGREEVIDRHIGRDEVHAIGVCRAFVTAQRQYADEISAAGGGVKYAQKFKSTPGQKDGLYWAAAGNEPASPFGPLVAEAQAEGYVNKKGAGPHPFHGYYFRILTRQGAAAHGGKMSYLSHGDLTKGYALVAYPEHWDQSGIMTFIVDQDGEIFQRNLGVKTCRLAAALKEFNPDSQWTAVEDQGELSAASEK